MTFSDWYYNHATEEEKRECQEVAARTACMEIMRQIHERTLYKLRQICTGKGLTIVADRSSHCLRWRVVEAREGDEMQFATEEVALEFCREEARTVADWLCTIEARFLVMLNGKAVVI